MTDGGSLDQMMRQLVRELAECDPHEHIGFTDLNMWVCALCPFGLGDRPMAEDLDDLKHVPGCPHERAKRLVAQMDGE